MYKTSQTYTATDGCNDGMQPQRQVVCRETRGVCTKRGTKMAKGHGPARVQGRAIGAGAVRAGSGAQEGASDMGRAVTVARAP